MSASPKPRAASLPSRARHDRCARARRTRGGGTALHDRDPLERAESGERRRRARARELPRRRRSRRDVAVPERHQQDEPARGCAGRRSARRRGDRIHRRQQRPPAQAESEVELGAREPRGDELPAERSDLLRTAATAVRVHDRAQRARPAADRQPGLDRDPRRARGRERELSARRPRLSDRGGHDHRLQQGLRGQPARRVPVPDHVGHVRAASGRPGRSASGQHRHDDHARRSHGAVHRALGARHDQSLHLQRGHARADERKPIRANPTIRSGTGGSCSASRAASRSDARRARSAAEPRCATTRSSSAMRW